MERELRDALAELERDESTDEPGEREWREGRRVRWTDLERELARQMLADIERGAHR